jgi:hypothetical protein
MATELEPFRILGLEIHRVVQVGDLLTSFTILTGALGAMFSLRRVRLTQQAVYYSELDHFYAEILKAAIDEPHLRTPAKISNDDDAVKQDYLPYSDLDPAKREQYDTYAYIVWNFLETLHDRCVANKALRRTWEPVIRTENALHRGWFLAQMRNEALRKRAEGNGYLDTHKFCEEFRIFVFDRQWDDKWKYRDNWKYRKKWKKAPDFGF